MKKRDVMRKSPALYITMLLIWVCLAVFLWWNFLPKIIEVPFFVGKRVSVGMQIGARILLTFNGVFISYFWLNGVKDFIYVIWYYIFRKKMYARYYDVIETDVSGVKDKVLMAYCTCNDFDGRSLEESMRQSYPFVTTVILDDSTTAEYKKAVDEFAQKHGVAVVRRKDRKGFKAGNINHYLMSKKCKDEGYGYYVILDSDEILPPDYVYESLKYFYARKNIGIVQANHVSDRNRNFLVPVFFILCCKKNTNGL